MTNCVLSFFLPLGALFSEKPLWGRSEMRKRKKRRFNTKCNQSNISICLSVCLSRWDGSHLNMKVMEVFWKVKTSSTVVQVGGPVLLESMGKTSGEYQISFTTEEEEERKWNSIYGELDIQPSPRSLVLRRRRQENNFFALAWPETIQWGMAERAPRPFSCPLFKMGSLYQCWLPNDIKFEKITLLVFEHI